jgi:hypothetical protein
MQVVEPELELRVLRVSCELVASPSSVVTKVLVADTRVVIVVVVVRVIKSRQTPAESVPCTLGKG